MENYGLNMKGDIQIENVSTLPAWSASDERRIIYVADEDKIYYGSGTRWEHFVNNSYYVGEHNKGWLKRPKFEWVSYNTVYIYPGAYHYAGNGTTVPEQYVYWNDRLLFQFGTGASESLSNNDWHFIYLHAASINTYGVNGELDENCFINNATVAPALLTTGGYGVYYDTSRAIFAVKTNQYSEIKSFFHSGDYIQWTDDYDTIFNESVDTNWSTVDLDVPIVTNVNSRAKVTFKDTNNTTQSLWWRIKDQGTLGQTVGKVNTSDDVIYSTLDVCGKVNTGEIEIRHSGSTGTNTVQVFRNGYYLPDGM